MELKNAATGLGWNEARQTVDCDDKWWEEHLAVCTTLCTYFLIIYDCWTIAHLLLLYLIVEMS
jgi:hypothetical protein